MSGHKSDCAVHDAPAYSPGKCDCGFDEHLRIAKSYVGEDYDIVPKSQNGDDDYWFHKFEDLSKKYGGLSASNAELLKALRAILKLHEAHHNDPLHAQARGIIAKHEGTE